MALQRRPQAKAPKVQRQLSSRSWRCAEISTRVWHSLHVFESIADTHRPFPHCSTRIQCATLGSAAHWQAERVFLQRRRRTPGARHAPFAQREPPSVKTGQDGLMGAWIATNSSIAIRTEASKCSSPCSCGSPGCHRPPLRAPHLAVAIRLAHSVCYSRPANCAE